MSKELIMPLESTVLREATYMLSQAQPIQQYHNHTRRMATLFGHILAGEPCKDYIARMCDRSEHAERGVVKAYEYISNNSLRKTFILLTMSKTLGRIAEPRAKDGALLQPDCEQYYYQVGFYLYLTCLYEYIEANQKWEV